jgi:putative acyltransferase/acetyltransferase
MRNIHIDLLKGFAIVLVVVGHSIQTLTNDDLENPLFKFIYAFHMPLFMFLSGYVCFKPQGEKYINLKKRFKTLIIPFFVWWIISDIYAFLFHKDIISLIDLLANPDKGLWFLWVLFFLCAFLQISFTISKKYEEIVMFLIIICLAIIHFTPYGRYLGISLMLWYIVFFSFGYIFHKHENLFSPYRHFWGVISILIFSFTVPFWHFGSSFTFMESYSFPTWSKSVLYLFFRYLIPISGILSFYYIFNLFSFQRIWIKLILYIAPITLEIYAIHYYFLYLFHSILLEANSTNLYLKVVLLSFIALMGSLFVQKLISKNKYINRLFFGK